ncbi:histidine-type phosphatase [Erwinia sorbitola]|uniref:Histidine-type phosphatase n=1 Tax=Erwinia sorbitola TaxID=2681984 RepID=A0A6I6EVT3_9GAMM|nr:histidine-type phosphatase [Erwinia sorbitola]MTD27146.1 histidine-type phosphatase [Erwinia sorbitola]QGU88702.1 histidine-type phosphatase [Erwinia sorbitola]
MLTIQTALSRLAFALIMVPVLSSQVVQAADFELEKVVEVSRHGVRPPTPDNTKAMEAGTDRPWPQWLTADGELTGHGYAAAVLKGGYEANGWRQAGLLTSGCPDSKALFVWASPLQRTKATAKALTDGAFPGCDVTVHSVSDDSDPLFQSDKMGLAPLDEAKARAGIQQAMGGTVEQAEQRAAPEIARLKAVVCLADHPCPIFDRPWSIKRNKDGRFEVEGLATLANMAETFRLAWSENQPSANVAFGHVHSAADVAKLMPLLTTKYDYINDVPYIARRGGSVLMDQIAKGLAAKPVKDGPPDVRWLLYVAHDTNISWLRTMLDFSWQLAEYPRGNIPPAGSLVFERWRETHSGKRYIRLYFQAQTLDQIRNLAPLAGKNALVRKEFSAPDCRITSAGVMCPYDSMMARITHSIDRSAVTPVHY